MKAEGRVYGGRTEAERREDRRARLLEAALELFGTEGFTSASIERLCAQAQVATRYFYELFSDREALLRALYVDLRSQATEAVITALLGVNQGLADQARAGIAAYVGFHTADPRRALVVHREARAVGALERERYTAMLSFASLVEQAARTELPTRDPQRQRVLALALAAGVSEVLVDWVSGEEPRPPTGPIIDELAAIYLAALAPRPSP